ncbi:RNA polymerase sigma factor RpoD/SigA [candidate division CSSED10-310 bacterium]|uniref:RNA polymerase sigma factor RpoD/SigA n=1 Tax=candidate division CSSED10-310 bacterium TaxID=2855610 RepID=A0ABV6Z415_UNCC1
MTNNTFAHHRENGNTLALYLKDIRKIPRISREEEVNLGRKIQKGDDEAKERLIKGNLRLVVHVARQFYCQRLTFLDLINEGNLGLITAAGHYNPDLGTQFASYASWWIKNNITLAIYHHDYVVKLPPKRAKMLRRIKDTDHFLTRKLADHPSLSVIAAALNEEETLVADVIRSSNPSLSLETTYLFNDNETINLKSFLTYQKDFEEHITKLILMRDIRRLLKFLSPMEAEVIQARYCLDGEGDRATLKSIGERFNLTKERIRQIEEKAKSRLRELVCCS